MEFKVQKEVLDSGVKIVFAAVDGMDFCGGSVVIDSLGNITAHADDSEQLLCADIDMSSASEIRAEKPCTSLILITNKTIDKKSSHNPYTQDYAQFFV
jgi:predicted amidohydrolase